MSDLIGRDGVWSKLPKHVSNAVRKYCIDHNFVGDDGHISYVYGECALAAISAQPQSPTPEAQPAGEAALLPCPFCGSLPFKALASQNGACSISCLWNKCPASPEIVEASESEAIRVWNTRVQSTPPEQRAESQTHIADCPICAPGPCIGGAHRNAMIEDGAITPGVAAAHPEAVRMPIELPPLEGDGSNDWRYGMQLRAEIRESQLFAALTDIQTERAAHERTRVELEQAWKSRHEWFHATSEANSKRYAVEREVRDLKAELESLRAEVARKS